MRNYKVLFCAVVLVSFTLCGFAGESEAQVNPVGVWELNITGNVLGTAVIQFYDDSTLAGFVLIKAKPTKSPTVPNPLLVGFTDVSGQWGLNGKGQLIGFFDGGSTGLHFDMSFVGNIKGTTISFDATGNDGRWHFRGAPAVDLPF